MSLPSTGLFFFKTGPFAWSGVMSFWLAAFAFFAWSATMAPVLARAIRTQAADEAATSGPSARALTQDTAGSTQGDAPGGTR